MMGQRGAPPPPPKNIDLYIWLALVQRFDRHHQTEGRCAACLGANVWLLRLYSPIPNIANSLCSMKRKAADQVEGDSANGKRSKVGMLHSVPPP